MLRRQHPNPAWQPRKGVTSEKQRRRKLQACAAVLVPLSVAERSGGARTMRVRPLHTGARAKNALSRVAARPGAARLSARIPRTLSLRGAL